MTINDIKSGTDIQSQLKFQDFEFTDSPNISSSGAGDTSGFGLGAKTNWTNLNFYTKYFNVTTVDFQERIIAAAMADGLFLEKLNGRLDFYGPLWISITVAILLFVSSSLAKIVWPHTNEFIDFHLITFGIIEMILFTSFQTALSWGFFRWRAVDGVKIGEMAALNGYSLVPLVPALLLSAIPLSITQWAAFTAATVLSCLFIYRNLWPILQTSPTIRHEHSALFITLLLGVQVIFILSLKAAFFRHTHIPAAPKL